MSNAEKAAAARYPINGTVRDYQQEIFRSVFADGFKAGRRDALEEATQVAESGLFDGDAPRSSDEAAYNTARREAAEAIRALIVE